jgi:hypothetical protein
MGKFSIVATIKTVPGKRDAAANGLTERWRGAWKGAHDKSAGLPDLAAPEYMGHLASTPSMESA